MKTYLGEPGLHYLCPGYKKFFRHIRKYLRAMTQLLENGLPASLVMDAFKGPLVIKLDTYYKIQEHHHRLTARSSIGRTAHASRIGLRGNALRLAD